MLCQNSHLTLRLHVTLKAPSQRSEINLSLNHRNKLTETTVTMHDARMGVRGELQNTEQRPNLFLYHFLKKGKIINEVVCGTRSKRRSR
jgi:hypothetical protein